MTAFDAMSETASPVKAVWMIQAISLPIRFTCWVFGCEFQASLIMTPLFST